MDLIIHHMLQSLVISRPKEHLMREKWSGRVCMRGSHGYLSVEFASSEAIVEHLVATEMVAVLVKQF